MAADDETLLLKLRCAKSASSVHDGEHSLKVQGLVKIRPDKPCHKIRASLLSSSNGNSNHTGIINVMLIFQVVSVVHSVLENLLKYGILFDPVPVIKVFFYKLTESPSSLILLGLFVLPLISLGIEVLHSKGLLGEKVGLTIITTLLTSEILVPAIILYYTDSHVLPTFTVMFSVVCVSMKLVSYHVTNFWCREFHVHTQIIRKRSVTSDRGRRKDIGNGNGKANLVHYPENLNFKDLYYFLLAPTLCYELNFPRSARIRKMFLIKRVLEMIFLLLLIVCFVQQIMVPTLRDSLKFFQESEYSGLLDIFLKIIESDWLRIPEIVLKLVVNDCLRLLEVLLKLLVPISLTFLMSAYFLYHSYLNTIAEILRFGDRYFYNEFWNSESAVDFWQNFNVPVHKWCIRHIYVPLRHRGFTDFQTSTAIFFLSAVFHEYFFIVSLKIFSFWSFLFMMIQVPYSMITSKYLPIQYGTVVGSFFIALASAFINIMYYHDYYTIYH